jgi:hypothetical protein
VRSAFSNQRHVDHDACTYRSPSSCGDSSSRSFRPTPGCTATRTAPWAASNPGAPPGRLADPGRRPKTRTARTTSLRKAVARLCQGRRGEPSPPWFEKWPLKPLRASLIARAAAARATRRRSRSLLDHPGALLVDGAYTSRCSIGRKRQSGGESAEWNGCQSSAYRVQACRAVRWG